MSPQRMPSWDVRVKNEKCTRRGDEMSRKVAASVEDLWRGWRRGRVMATKVSLLKCRGVYFAQSLVKQNMTFVSLTVIGEEASDCYRLCDPTWNIGRGDVRLGVIIV